MFLRKPLMMDSASQIIV